jgi:hypothetical protein
MVWFKSWIIIVADMDNIATQSKDEEALEKSLVYPSYPYNNPKADFKAYTAQKNAYYKSILTAM